MLSSSPTFAPREWIEDPLFRGHHEALSALLPLTRWPTAPEMNHALGPLVERGVGRPVTFRTQRRREELRYEASIVTALEIPTRDASPHDLLNALIWATFPRGKLALHTRFHLAEAGRTAPGRTVFQDRLALVDEGAVVRPRAGAEGSWVVFGHAILEHRIAGVEQSRSSRAELLEFDSVHSTCSDRDLDHAIALALNAWVDPPPPRRPGVAVYELFPEAFCYSMTGAP